MQDILDLLLMISMSVNHACGVIDLFDTFGTLATLEGIRILQNTIEKALKLLQLREKR